MDFVLFNFADRFNAQTATLHNNKSCKFRKSIKTFYHCFPLPQETQQIPTEEVQLEIYLSNGQKVKVNILTSDQTEDVLEVRMLSCNYFQSTDLIHILTARFMPLLPLVLNSNLVVEELCT